MIDVPTALVDDLERVASKLRTTASARLGARLSGPFASRADAGRALARALAVATQGIADAAEPAMPRWRRLPELPDLAVGDQVRVVAHDFVAALPGAPELVWTPDGRVPLAELLDDTAATATEVARFV